jgi:signal transduction histidine kinase
MYDAPKKPIKTQVSETQIKQVFWNLLQNSIHAMPDGGNVVVKLNQLPGKRVQIVFQDSGPGISKDNLEHLFEPFSIAAGGTGLGLSIVHKIVNDNGGRIDVGTVNGEGTQITVELPR